MQLNFHILAFIAIAAFGILPASASSAAGELNVTGQITDASTGKPIEGATVEMSGITTNRYICKDGHQPAMGKNCRGEDVLYDKDQPTETKTGKDGRFVFTHVPDHAGMAISVRKRNYEENNVNTFVTGQAMGSISLKLTPMAAVTGIVRDAKSVPLKDVQVELCKMEGGHPNCNQRVSSKEDGSFFLGDVPPGKYYLVSEAAVGQQAGGEKGKAAGYVPVLYPSPDTSGGRQFFEIGQGGVVNVPLQMKMKPLHHVSGASGNAGYLSVADSDGVDDFYKVDINIEARHFDVWLPDGQYSLFDYYNKDASVDFKVAGADVGNVDLTQKDGTPVEFKVTISHPPDCGKQVFGCQFLLDISFRNIKDGTTPPLMANWNVPEAQVITLPPGKYAMHVRSMGPGAEYVKEAHAGTTDLTTQPLQVVGGSRQQTIQLVMSKGGEVDGTITKNGQPEGGWIYALPEKPDVMEVQLYQSSPEYQLAGLAPGNYYIVAVDGQPGLDFSDAGIIELSKKIGKKVTIKDGEVQRVNVEVSHTAGPDGR